MNIELKPCPFCGGEALTRSVDGGCLPSFMDLEKQREIRQKTPYVTTCTLSCDECGATDDLNNDDLYNKAVEDCYRKWNRRVKE